MSAPTTAHAALRVVDLTPANGTAGVVGSQPVTVTFSAPISGLSPQPTLTPHTPGSWAKSAQNTLTFTPTDAFAPDTPVTLTVPAGMRSVDGATLTRPFAARFSVGHPSVLRLQQLLSLLGYSPLAWSPAGSPVPASDQAAQALGAFSPPAGSFTWRAQRWPAQLTSQWQPGVDNVFTRGLVMAFEADHGLATDGIAGAKVWSAVLDSLAQRESPPRRLQLCTGVPRPPRDVHGLA